MDKYSVKVLKKDVEIEEVHKFHSSLNETKMRKAGTNCEKRNTEEFWC
jgi:hypothetical protein